MPLVYDRLSDYWVAVVTIEVGLIDLYLLSMVTSFPWLELGLCVTSLGQLPWLPGFHGYQVSMVK